MKQFFESLENEYKANLKNFEDHLAKAKALSKEAIISKGFLYNLRPFEKESNGFKKGKALKAMPANVNDVYVYFFDAVQRIIYIEKYGKAANIIDYEFCYYKKNELLTFYYSSGGPQLRNVKLSIFNNNKTVEVYNYGKFGVSQDSYNYNDDLLESIENKTKEHTKPDFKTATLKIINNSDGTLKAISKVFDNGFIKELYPELK